jgi:hypothetical protein
MLARVFGALVYLAAAGVWMLLMGIMGALRCDESCSSNSSSWTDNAQAWQYDVLPWLGVAGVALAILAVALSLFSHVLGVAVVGLHAGVFIANTVLLSSGGDVNALALLVPSAVAIVAAYLAVGGSRLRAG